MPASNARTVKTKRGRRPTTPQWSESLLRQELEALIRDLLPAPVVSNWRGRQRVVEEIVSLAMQPENWSALQERYDPREAAKDIAVRYALQQGRRSAAGRPRLDPLSEALLRDTHADIVRRAAQMKQKHGEDPLDADPGLLAELCETFSEWVPHKPMGSHIQFKLKHPDGPVNRAMQHIEDLVTHDGVRERFVAWLEELTLPASFRAHLLHRAMQAGRVRDPAALPYRFKGLLLQMARGGGRRGVDPDLVLHFFALPEVVQFVKSLADHVQTARTLYAEHEYQDIAWRGKRALTSKRPRQGYMERALASILRLQDPSLDTDSFDAHELLEDPHAPDLDGHAWRKSPFEVWITRNALEAHPESTLWQAAKLLFIDGLAPEEIQRRGLASAEDVEAARQAMEERRADPVTWEAWMQAIVNEPVWETKVRSMVRHDTWNAWMQRVPA